MKYLLITLFSISLFACQKEEEPKGQPSITEEWTQGGGEVFKTIQSTSNPTFQLLAGSESLCPNTGIEIIFSSDDGEHFRDTINTFPYDESFRVPANAEIQIHSNMEYGLGQHPEVDCVWTGVVDFSLAY